MERENGPPAEIRWVQRGSVLSADHGGYRVEIRSDPDPLKPKVIELKQGEIVWHRFTSAEKHTILKVNGERWLRGGQFWPLPDEQGHIHRSMDFERMGV